MRRRLKTTTTRVMLAAALGVLVPTLAGGLPVAIMTDVQSDTNWIYALILCAAYFALFMLLIGAPAWFLMHRLGAGTALVAVCGAAGGALAIGFVGMIAVLLDDARDPYMILGLAVIALAAAVIGAGLVALMWMIAYPRSIQPQDPVEVF